MLFGDPVKEADTLFWRIHGLAEHALLTPEIAMRCVWREVVLEGLQASAGAGATANLYQQATRMQAVLRGGVYRNSSPHQRLLTDQHFSLNLTKDSQHASDGPTWGKFGSQKVIIVYRLRQFNAGNQNMKDQALLT